MILLLNQNGQAYSTFKLLIAAIVAMAILAILIPIILQVLNIIKSDPTTEATTALNDLVDRPGTLKHTKEVIFEPQSTLAGQTLANKLPISKDQICMSLGDFEDNDDFELIEANEEWRILYGGASDQQAKIALICNVNQEELDNDFGFYGLDEYVIDCRNCGENSKCCALFLRTT